MDFDCTRVHTADRRFRVASTRHRVSSRVGCVAFRGRITAKWGVGSSLNNYHPYTPLVSSPAYLLASLLSVGGCYLLTLLCIWELALSYLWH